TDVVGKSFLINDKDNLKITGVIEDVPKQSHFNFDFFVSLNGSIENWEINQWTSNNHNTYLLLKKGSDPKALEAKFDDWLVRYITPELKQLNMTLEGFKKSGNYIHYGLTPLTSIHIHSNKTSE